MKLPDKGISCLQNFFVYHSFYVKVKGGLFNGYFLANWKFFFFSPCQQCPDLKKQENYLQICLFFISNFLVTNLAENNISLSQTFTMQQNTNFYIASDLTYQNGVRHYQHQPWNVEDTDLLVKKLSNFFLICWQLASAYYVVFILFLLFTVCICTS